jgi:hypothetical protein
MSAFTKIAGFVAGVSAVAAVSVAVAQGVPPNPLISDSALGAGQQAKTHLRDGTIVYTPMGETGVLADVNVLQSYARIQREPAVAAAEPAPAQAPAQPAAAAPAEPVAQAPAPAPETNTASSMGAPSPEPQQVAKADRN